MFLNYVKAYLCCCRPLMNLSIKNFSCGISSWLSENTCMFRLLLSVIASYHGCMCLSDQPLPVHFIHPRSTAQAMSSTQLLYRHLSYTLHTTTTSIILHPSTINHPHTSILQAHTYTLHKSYHWTQLTCSKIVQVMLISKHFITLGQWLRIFSRWSIPSNNQQSLVDGHHATMGFLHRTVVIVIHAQWPLELTYVQLMERIESALVVVTPSSKKKNFVSISATGTPNNTKWRWSSGVFLVPPVNMWQWPVTSIPQTTAWW